MLELEGLLAAERRQTARKRSGPSCYVCFEPLMGQTALFPTCRHAGSCFLAESIHVSEHLYASVCAIHKITPRLQVHSFFPEERVSYLPGAWFLSGHSPCHGRGLRVAPPVSFTRILGESAQSYIIGLARVESGGRVHPIL